MTQAEGSGKSVIKVKLLRAGKVIRSYKIRSDVFTIGTAEGCNIRAGGDPNVRPLHASIYVDEGELTLVPEPDAVVYMNEQAVDFAVPGPGDVIQIGKLTIQVEIVESLNSVPPAARTSAGPSGARRTVPPVRLPKPSMPPASKVPSIAPVRPTMSQPSTSLPRPSSKAPASPVLPRPSSAPLPPVSEPSPTLPKPSGAPLAEARKSVPMAKPQVKTPPTPAPSPAQPPMELPPLDISFEPGPGLPDTDEDDTDRISVPPKHSSEPAADVSAFQSADASAPESADADRGFEDMPNAFEELDPDYFYGDDDDDFEDAFDLTSMLMSDRPASPPGPTEPYSVAYIVRVVDGAVAQSVGVTPGADYSTFDKEISCYIEVDKKDKEGKNNRLFLIAAPSVVGEIWVGGQKRELSDRTEPYKVELRDGDRAVLSGLGGIYKVDVYRPPLAPRKTPLLAVSARTLIAVIVLALAFHGAAAYALRYVNMSKAGDVAAQEEEVFAEVKLDKAEEPKPVEEVVQEAPKQNAAEIAERAPNVSQRTIKKRVKDTEQRTRTQSVNNLLNVLSRGSGKPGESNKLKDMVSNIDAVRSASGAASSFSIAGAIASLPGSGVNIARSGGGGSISTLSGDDVAGKGSDVGKVGKAKKSGKVRGKVTKMSSGAKIGGSLSQEDVLRVINSNIHAIQACYERALMSTPTLSGRIAMDWTVSSSGSVKNVRVRSSTMGNPKVADCMSAQIKRWKFPRPKGGEAQITFPFLFRSGS